MSHVIRKPVFCKCENKDADQLRNNCAADQLLCFRYIVLSLFYHNPKFKVSNHLLWLHSLICVGPVWKPRSSVPKTGFLMSQLKIQHVKLFLLFFVTQTDKNHISNDQINCYLKTDRSPTAYNINKMEILYPRQLNKCYPLSMHN